MFRRLVVVLVVLGLLYVGSQWWLDHLAAGAAHQIATPMAIDEFTMLPARTMLGRYYVVTGRVMATTRVGEIATVTLTGGDRRITIFVPSAHAVPASGVRVTMRFVVVRSFMIGGVAGPTIYVVPASAVWRPAA